MDTVPAFGELMFCSHLGWVLKKAEPEIGIQGCMGLGEANEEKGMHHKLRRSRQELGSAGVKPPPLQGGLESVQSSRVGLIFLVPHASWSLVWACLGVCLGRGATSPMRQLG